MDTFESNDITVILTVWKRNHLEEQLDVLLHQTLQPACIWVQQTQEHVDVSDIVKRYESDIVYTKYEINKGVFGRFESVKDVDTPYVYIIDDDIIPGDIYLENALNACQRLQAIISPNGRLLNETDYIKEYIGDDNAFQHSFCIEDTMVDIGNNAWFFKTEWIRFFLQESPVFRHNGEDIHLSATCKLYGEIPTYVPKQIIPNESGNTKRIYSADEHALHKKNLFVQERQQVISFFREKGWKLVDKGKCCLDRRNKYIILGEQLSILEKRAQTIPVSVILPVYNGGEFIQEAIDSILNQTLSDFELIIIDDASTDGTTDILLSYTDYRIIYLRNEKNLGNYPSRNIGLKLARGRYIAVMDSDDIAFPERLERQFSYMEAHSDILAVGTSFLYGTEEIKRLQLLTEDEIKQALLDNNCFLHSSLMIRTNVLRALGGYDETYRYSSDYELVCRLVLSGKVVNMPDILMKYRWHPNQISCLHAFEQQKFAGKIREKYQMTFVNQYVDSKIELPLDAYMLKYPELGCAISLYVYAKHKKDLKSEAKADDLLDYIIDRMKEMTTDELNMDLYSIGCGMIFLLRNGFVQGDENLILKHLDIALDWNCLSWNWTNREGIYICIHYLSLRLDKSYGLYGNRCRQNLICLLDYLDYTDLYEENKVLVNDIEKLSRLNLCPAIVNQLFYTSEVNEELTIVIPLRLDSRERENNLDMILEQLSGLRNIKIIILEADSQSFYRLKKNYTNVTYLFVKDEDPVFYRTHYINKLLSEANTRIVGVWDTDVIIPEPQIREAVSMIEKGEAAMCFPYDGHFCMLSPDCNFQNKTFLTVLNHSVGGAFLVNKDVYLSVGGENENFYGWGCEDLERVKRMRILELPIRRTKGSLYHLYHPKGRNSGFREVQLEMNNRSEFLSICKMTKQELLQYIKSWEWLSVN